MREEADLSLEVLILLILGVFALLFGLLLLRIHTGALPYNPDSTYGLFLVIVSFQTITMGKTPFGDLRRSWALVIIGTGTAVLGMASCFILGYLTNIVRILVGTILSAGGLTLLVQLFFSEKKAKLWMKTAGILRQLTVGCGLVYVLGIVLGMITLLPGITNNPQTSVLLIIYGIGFFYLSWCIREAVRSYPPEITNDSTLNMNPGTTESKTGFGLFREASLPLSSATLILLGSLLGLLGLLLFPVNLGILRFSPDGQLGLLLTVMAIQMTAMGDTPVGQCKRSWLIIILGIVFAGLGIVSCIVPGMLAGMITLFLGALNIIGGIVFLTRWFLRKRDEIKTPVPAPVPPIVKKLTVTQIALNMVSITFGISMLVPGLLPGLINAAVLVINGVLLFVLASFLQKLAGMQSNQ